MAENSRRKAKFDKSIQAQKDETEQQMNEWEQRTYKLTRAAYIIIAILAVVVLGAIVAVVLVQFASSNDDYQVSAEICNTFTGIVLGFVAMTVSVIGMALSFYNTIQAEKSNTNSAKQFFESMNTFKDLSDQLDSACVAFSKKTDELSVLLSNQESLNTFLNSLSADIKAIKANTENSKTVKVDVGDVQNLELDDNC